MANTCAELDCITFGREYLLTALERCTPEVLDFRPPSGDHKMYSVREHFLHIADVGEQFVNVNFVGFCTLDEFQRVASKEVGGEFFLTGEWPDAASVRAELEKSWAYQDQHVFGRPVADLLEPATLRKTALAEEIFWFIFHESQHRGQILTLMRMAGAEPPSW